MFRQMESINDTETNGLSNTQLAWIKWSQEQAEAEGKEHTFIFTHGPFTGHEDESDDEPGIYSHDQNDGNFVKWVNGEAVVSGAWNILDNVGNEINGLSNLDITDYDGYTPQVEAYFSGHTHHPWACYGVTSTLYDGGNVNHYDEYDVEVYDYPPISYSENVWYFEAQDLKDGGWHV